MFAPQGAVTIPTTGTFARWDEARVPAEALHTDRGVLPVELVEYREVTNLPEPRAGMAYLVSRVLAVGLDRGDVYFPCGEIRDDDGNIIGCGSLGTFCHGTAG